MKPQSAEIHLKNEQTQSLKKTIPPVDCTSTILLHNFPELKSLTFCHFPNSCSLIKKIFSYNLKNCYFQNLRDLGQQSELITCLKSYPGVICIIKTMFGKTFGIFSKLQGESTHSFLFCQKKET